MRILAILYKNGESLGKVWHSQKFVFLEMVSNNVIENGESENRGPRAQMCAVYVVANVVL